MLVIAWRKLDYGSIKCSPPLSGAVLDAKLGDDFSVPLLPKSTYSPDVLEAKKKQVMDQALHELEAGYWKPEMKYDSWPVTTTHIASAASPSPYNDYSKTKALLKANVTDFCANDDIAKAFRQELRFLWGIATAEETS
jgi:hypothetical protein